MLPARAMNRFHLAFACTALVTIAACGGATTPEPTSSESPTPKSATETTPGATDEPSDGETSRHVPEKAGEISPTNATVRPFHILTSNQSFDLDPVDIDLYVDGQHVVTGDFVVEGQHTWIVEGQHTWINFDFEIGDGTHELRAVTKKGAVEKVEKFSVAGERWAVVDFWYAKTRGSAEETPPSFGMNLYDEQPRFQ
jgi:hypothetical protein